MSSPSFIPSVHATFELIDFRSEQRPTILQIVSSAFDLHRQARSDHAASVNSSIPHHAQDSQQQKKIVSDNLLAAAIAYSAVFFHGHEVHIVQDHKAESLPVGRALARRFFHAG